MRLPLRWLREFLEIAASPTEIADRLTMAGLEVEAIENHAPAFAGVVVARVLTVERHPNADRLSLCEVDAGPIGRFRVVCGAPNVRAGMVSAYAQVGARLKAAGHGAVEQAGGFAPQLEAAVIRGVRSEGMLCSERELGLSAEHAGILDLSNGSEPGTDLAEYLQLADTVLDVTVMPNRGDCMSIFGLARELAALFGVRVRTLSRRRAAKARDGVGHLSIAVDIRDPDLCPRYAALAMERVRIGPSPLWLQRRLELCGMRAVNNVVDATNYVMLELGQPLHAFDLRRLAGPKIVVRRAGNDREMVTLDGIARTLVADDLLICDAERPVALAGVMGGQNSEVGETTDAVLLESAYFDPVAIARTSRRLGLRSEASARFERGIDRAVQVTALWRVAELIRKYAGGRLCGQVTDVDAKPAEPRTITLDVGRMEGLLGVRVPLPEVRRRLRAIGAQVASAPGNRLYVTVPSFRGDLSEMADLAEEVARLKGLAEVPATLAPVAGRVAVEREWQRSFRCASRDLMLGCGLTEVRTISLTAAAENERFGGLDRAAPVRLQNPLSAELGEMRRSLLGGLLQALRFNLNREASAFHAFEIGRVYGLVGDAALEAERLAALTYGDYVLGRIGAPPVRADFFTLKGIVERYFEGLGLDAAVRFEPLTANEVPYLHPGKAARIVLDGRSAGVIGELHPAEARRLELAYACALCEVDLSVLMTYESSPRRAIEPPPRFPSVGRDLALVVDRGLPADQVVRAVVEAGPAWLERVELFDVYEGEPMAVGKKSVGLACRYRARDRTLTDAEVNRAHEELIARVTTRLGAELRA